MALPPKIADLVPALGLIPHPEGGFFLETWRSGSTPMSTRGQTGLDCTDPSRNLVVAHGRKANRPDGDERRNALTSIYWAPTLISNKLRLVTNESDHVHFFHGGRPFQYCLFDPEGGDLINVTLGPELEKGHQLQVCVRGGVWKFGSMDETVESGNEYEYTLIGEAVAPGFDFYDFKWITEEQVRKKCKNPTQVSLLLGFVHDDAQTFTKEDKLVKSTSRFYEKNDTYEDKRK